MTYRYEKNKYFDSSLYGLNDIECGVTHLVKQADYLSENEKQQLIDCCFFAAQSHREQKRRSGEPYICHPLKVAEILAKEVRFDLPVLQAAVLHDVIEDTDVTKPEVEAVFGKEVANLVDGVSKLEKESGLSPKELQARTFEKLVHAMQADPRVVMIKFADRMHNMQTLVALRPDKRRRIARETLDVYVPIASRLGMYIFKSELEELVFKQVHPWRYDIMHRLLEGNAPLQNTVDDVIQTLQNAFCEESISVSIRERRRSLSSVYQKIKKSHNNRRPLENVSIPFVILTDSIEDCYRALGLIHQIYTPVFLKLVDYIASPKVNGYQSLHTSVLTSDRRVINFQIRTKAMHAVAESGIIAIWRYHNQNKKTGVNRGLSKDKSMRRWLDDIKLLSSLSTTPVEFYEAVKRDLSRFEMQVLTPKGEPIGLPNKATVIDFAYHIHTGIGNQLESAKVNGVDVPLDYQLSDGQTVEVFTNVNASPRTSWFSSIKTARARTGIRHYLQSLPKEELATIGYSKIKKYLKSKGLEYRDLEKQLSLIAEKHGDIKSLCELLCKVAVCEIKTKRLMKELKESVCKESVSAKLAISAYNDLGVLAALSDIIAKHEANIVRIHFPNNVESGEMTLVFELDLPSTSYLDILVKSLRQSDTVKTIKKEEIH
ncbi:MAG: RelA/SpoT family protein [Gammaproteobacteria bacterium]|nr:RelA/SpoT family protein [Gammaproteobacteria bacterium]